MSKKTIIKKCGYLLLLVVLSMGLTVPVSAATKKGTHEYTCKHHNYKTCQHVRLACDYTGKKIKSTWWDSSYTHWPNGVKFGSRGSGTGYARGTYIFYSSLITQWASVAFSTRTATIYIYV